MPLQLLRFALKRLPCGDIIRIWSVTITIHPVVGRVKGANLAGKQHCRERKLGTHIKYQSVW